MDDELRQYLAGMKGEIIDTLTEQMREVQNAVKTEVVDTLTERMRDMQSEILRGFEPFQKQTSVREAAMEARIGAAEQRLAVVQDRLVEIEKKLLLNPLPISLGAEANRRLAARNLHWNCHNR